MAGLMPSCCRTSAATYGWVLQRREREGLMQAFAMGLDSDPDNTTLRDGLQAVNDDLTGNDLREVSERWL